MTQRNAVLCGFAMHFDPQKDPAARNAQRGRLNPTWYNAVAMHPSPRPTVEKSNVQPNRQS